MSRRDFAREAKHMSDNGSDHPTIFEVKRKWQDWLLTLDGVEGVSVGKVGPLRVIRVLVSSITTDVDESIPDELDSYPVVVEVSGPFHARQPIAQAGHKDL